LAESLQNSPTRLTVDRKPVARIELDNGIGLSIDEASLPLIIGRDANCDIYIPSGHVSRRHCELYLLGGVLCLKDTSTNGTIINKRIIRQSSVSIKGPTAVVFASEVLMTVTPYQDGKKVTGEDTDEEKRIMRDRRRSDRRQGDRRQNVITVNFERRNGIDRRTGEDRRARERRVAHRG